MPELLSELTRNEVFRVYVFWSGVLVVKMLFMSLLTGMQRFRTKVRFLILFYFKLLCHSIIMQCIHELQSHPTPLQIKT